MFLQRRLEKARFGIETRLNTNRVKRNHAKQGFPLFMDASTTSGQMRTSSSSGIGEESMRNVAGERKLGGDK